MTIKVKRSLKLAKPKPAHIPRWVTPQGKTIDVDGSLFDSDAKEVCMGIDPSLTGFSIALVNSTGNEHYAWRFTAPKGWPTVLRLMEIERFISYRTQEIVSANLFVRAIAMESAAYGSEFAREIMGAVQGAALRSLIIRYGRSSPVAYPYMVAPNSLKKWVTGKGVGPKDQISKSLYKKYGIDVPNSMGANDLADALGLSTLARGVYLDNPVTKAETEVLNTVREKTEWPKYQALVQDSNTKGKSPSSGSGRPRRSSRSPASSANT